MEEDILTLMEALTTQAIDADPDPAAAASVGVGPPIQTLPLEEALSTACHRVNVEQKTAHRKKTEETREMFGVCPCLSTVVPGRCADVAPEVPSHTNSGGNRGKKSSRKRRNRKKSKKVYLSWPMTLEARASSTSPFPCQASAMGALSGKKQRRRKGKKQKTVISAQFWQDPSGTVLPEASTGQSSQEGTSVTVRKGRRAQKRHRCKKRAKKNQKIESSPWPVTVQAWASFVRPDLMQTSFTESLLAANNGIEDDVSVFTLYKSPQADLLDSPAPLVQASWEEVTPDVNPKRKKQRWQGRKGNALDPTWPLEIQAWVPFPAAAAVDPVQSLSEDLSLQWECWPPLERENESNCFIPWSEGAEEGPFSAIAPLQFSLKEAPALRIGQYQTDEAKRSPDTLEEQLQGSEELALESYQSWGKAEKYQGDQDGDDWEYSILNLSTQADCYYGDPFSEEGGQAPTLAGSYAYTSISQAETGKWEAEEDKATFQTLWMGKWGGL